MRKVVGIALPPGDGFVAAVRRIWDDGNAVFPIDHRLPDAELMKVLDAVRPTHVFDGSDTVPVRRGIPADDGDALVVATSGTTGHPKGVVLTHTAIEHSTRVTCEALEADPRSDRWLLCIPAAHMGGFSVVARSILTGTPLEAHPGFDVAAVEDAAARGATLTALVPTALHRIHPETFRRILLGGSAMPEDVPGNCIVTYGLTETAGGVVYDGRPLEGVEVRIVDGQIQIKSPTLLRQYRSGTDPKDDGWLPTGDRGHLDADGVLHVDGRADEMIITAGENVWPSRVEEALAMHPKVFDVAVTGRPDPEWTEAVTAIIVPIDPSDPPTLDDLRNCTKDVLPAYMAPKRLEYAEEIPRSPLGKIRRARL
jgi:O-succinylbenzoic acid--CoA ligase